MVATVAGRRREVFLFARNKTQGRATRIGADGDLDARGLQLLDLMLIPPPEANPGVRIP